MKEYRVEFTKAENVYIADINDDWYSEIIEADSYVEAFDYLKEIMIEVSLEPEEFIFRAKTYGDTEWVYD